MANVFVIVTTTENGDVSYEVAFEKPTDEDVEIFNKKAFSFEYEEGCMVQTEVFEVMPCTRLLDSVEDDEEE